MKLDCKLRRSECKNMTTDRRDFRCVGKKKRSPWSGPETQPSRSEADGPLRWIVLRPCLQHRHQHRERAITDDAQRVSLRMTASAMSFVECLQSVVVSDNGFGQEENGRPKSTTAGFAHHHLVRFSTLPRDRRDPYQSAQLMIISLLERLSGLAEHRGGDIHSDSGQGTKDGHVTMLDSIRVVGWLFQFIEQAFNRLARFMALLVDQLQSRKKHPHMRLRSTRDTIRHVHRWFLKEFAHLLCGPFANAMRFENRPDFCQTQKFRFFWRRRSVKQRNEPFVGVDASQFEQLRKDPKHLLIETARYCAMLLTKLIVHMRKLPQLEQSRIPKLDLAVRRSIRAERFRNHECIASIILCTRHRVSIAKAIELLWIDAIDANASLKKRVDDRVPSRFDSDGETFGFAFGKNHQSLDQRTHGRSVVRHRFIFHLLSLLIEHAHLMMRRAPIDSHKPSNFFHRVFSFLKRAAEMRTSLLFTGAHGATSDRTLHPDPSEKAHDPTRRLIRWRTGALFSEWPGLPHRIFVNEASQDVQEGNRRCARAQRRRARKGDRRKVPTRPSTRARAASPVGEGPYPVTFGLITRRVL